MRRSNASRLVVFLFCSLGAALARSRVFAAEPGGWGAGFDLPRIECGQVVEGVLEPSDGELDDGTWVDDYDFTLSEEQTIVAIMLADDFEPFVFIDDFFFDLIDSGFPPLESMLQPDDYVLTANNLDVLPDGRYPYRLGLSCGKEEAASIRCGETVAGQLDPGDDRLPEDDTWYDQLAFELDRPARVTFDLVGLEFGTYLFVNDADNEQILNDVPPFALDLEAGSYLVYPNNLVRLEDGTYPYLLSVTCEGGCPGDCDGDGVVATYEVVRGVGIALGSVQRSECPAFDGDGDGTVGVTELVRAVNAALNGCA